MDQQEKQLLAEHAVNDPELKSLWDDHLLFEKQIEKLESRSYLTPAEQQTLKQLKKQKLDGKTRMMHILDGLKQGK